MYSIWNDSFSNIERQFIRKNISYSNSPLMFITKTRGLTSKFKIEELDLLTSRYKDEEVFCEELLKYGDKYLRNPDYKKITITHSKNNILYKDETIYNDKFITSTASEVVAKKLNKKEKEKIELSNSQGLLDFINYIKLLALNENSQPYLLNPFSLGIDISNDDKYNLKQLIKDDVKDKDGRVIHRGLKGLLKEYVYYNEIKEQCIAIEEDILVCESNLNNIEKRINSYIRSDYKTIRDLVVWEKCYLRILGVQLEKAKNEEDIIKFNNLIDEVKTQRLYRNGKISKEGLQSFYEERDYNHIPAEYPSKIIENEMMEQLFREGGIDLVMEHFDIDSLYNNKSNYNDAVKLGIITKKK